MNERDLRRLIGKVKAGGLSRRSFVQKLAAVGVTAPLAAQLLAHAGVAMAQSMRSPATISAICSDVPWCRLSTTWG